MRGPASWALPQMSCRSWAKCPGCPVNLLPQASRDTVRIGSHLRKESIHLTLAPGMARVFLTIKALMQIAYNEAVDPRVPPPYFEIQQRLEKKNDVWEEMLTEAYAPELAKTSRSKL